MSPMYMLEVGTFYSWTLFFYSCMLLPWRYCYIARYILTLINRLHKQYAHPTPKSKIMSVHFNNKGSPVASLIPLPTIFSFLNTNKWCSGVACVMENWDEITAAHRISRALPSSISSDNFNDCHIQYSDWEKKTCACLY